MLNLIDLIYVERNLLSHDECDIIIEEKPTGEVMAGAGYGTDGSTFSVGVRENNFKGEGINLNTKLSLTAQTVKGFFEYTHPNFAYSDRALSTSLESSVTDKYVRMYGSSGSGRWDIYGNGTNLRISDNDSAGKVVVDTNLDVNGGDLTLSGAAPTISLTDTNNDPDYQLKNNNGAFQLDQGTSDTKFGITTDGHVEFPNDSQEIRIGEDADLVLSHTGTNSIIKFQGDGSLFFQYGTTNIASIGSQGFNAITGLST